VEGGKMNKKQFLISLVFISVFSFLGGIVGGAMSSGKMSSADTEKRIKDGKFDFLESKWLFADSIEVKKLFIKNFDGYTTIVLGSDILGPRLEFYSDKHPYGARIPPGKDNMSTKEHKEWLENSKQTKPVFGITIFSDGPHMWFADKDFDERISIAVNGLDPYIAFRYNNKQRLLLGTNELTIKSTGSEQKIKGSICAFDNKGKVIGLLP
jgi:hypothetical protein